ncbi:substrate-binding domain-containing protein [Arthrobacter nitrophenolicus]|uniref:substrate-binding domain-containing protein n=1 Tax=Arthrobacter nitrophenolicus TaxID=683150 RepID=UPI003B8A65BA
MLAHLARQGHTKVAYARSTAPLGWNSRTETRAVEDAAGRNMEVTLLGPFLPTVESGFAATAEVLRTTAAACVASSTVLALGMLERCKQMGLSVPGQLSLIGCEDNMGATFCSPSLTTLSTPLEEVGLAAARMVTAMVGGSAGAGLRVVVPTALTLRASTAA